MDDFYEDESCPNCGGEGVIYCCFEEFACIDPESGCDLCERRCDWCQPANGRAADRQPADVRRPAGAPSAREADR